MAPLWEKLWSYIPHYTQIFPKSKPYVFPNFGETQGEDKTTNWCLSLRSKIPVIARPVRLSGVAIPPLEGKCTENYPEEWDLLRFLVVIVTWFLSTGGLPRQFANWLAMTALFFKHQFIAVLWVGADSKRDCEQPGVPGVTVPFTRDQIRTHVSRRRQGGRCRPGCTRRWTAGSACHRTPV